MGNSASSSRFGFKSTAEEVSEGIDLSGKNVIVTGSNTGIGLETVRVLAKRGATVILANRDAAKTQNAIETIKKEVPNAKLEVIPLDLASLDSIKKFATEFDALKKPLHILINNAGIMACPYAKTADGFELQIGTNHIGHFYLTNLLLPRLKEGAPSRVISVSSAGHQMAGINWADPQSENSYWAWRAYGQSKSANILFAQELNKRYSTEGVYANSLHPGVIGATELSRHMLFPSLLRSLWWTGFIKDIPQGAATQVYVATAPELEKTGGLYFQDSNVTKASAHATNPEFAQKLWEESEKWVTSKGHTL